MRDLVIIGGGPAGLTAAIYAKRQKLDVLLVAKDLGGQVAKSGEIENYPGLRVKTGLELIGKFEEHVASLKLEMQKDKDVVRVSKDKFFTVYFADGKEVQAKAVIIASGRRPRKLDVKGEKEFLNRGVTYCWICDAPLFKGKKVAVIGGGNSATEAALALSDIAEKVILIYINEELQGEQILIEAVKNSKNIEELSHQEITEIYGSTMVEGVRLRDIKNGEASQLEVQGLFVEIGSIPNSDLIRELVALNEAGEIIVDDMQQTNVPGLFAAGDITNGKVKQIVVAAAEGSKAALACYNYLKTL